MKKNRILSSMLAFLIVLSLANVSLAKTGNEKIDWLVEKEFVVGGGDGDLNLEGNLSREEAATIIVKALGKEALAPLYQGIVSKFTDMSPKIWSNGMINVAVEEKVVSGFPNNTFGPKQNITYQEIITMLVQVKGGLTKQEIDSAPWPTPYILKAGELGITEDVKIEDIKSSATRLKSFELLYNTVAKGVITDEQKGLSEYTAMVTEVERVYPMDKDEMGLVIFKTAEDNKYKAKDYTRVKFENIDNAENLLGKVIKVSLDENNMVKKHEIDNSYDYLMGNVEFKKDTVVLNGETYLISLNNTTGTANNKLQFVYHDDKQISYNQLYSNGDSDFARITVDNNRVIGIESFSFSKVEPIEKVDGNRIIFVDGKATPVDKSILLKDNILGSMNLADVKAMDIGHIYGDNNILVSKGIELKGKLENVLSTNGKDVVIKIDEKDYKVSNKFNMRYSTDGKNFITLDSNKAYDDLYALRGQELVYGIDAAGNLKYIVSSKVTNEEFYIVDRILSKDIRLIDVNGNKVEFELDLKSKMENTAGRTIETKDLNLGDLVYLTKNDKYIEKLVLVKNYNDIKKSSVEVEKDSTGKFVLGGKYIANNDVKSLLFHESGDQLKEVEGLEINKILSSTRSNSNLKMFILSDYDFDQLGLSKNVITSGEKDRLNLVIFTGFEQTLEGTKEEIVKLKYRFRSGYDTEIEGYVGETSVKRKLDKDVKLQDMALGDYVKVYLNNEDKIVEGELIFRDSDKFVEVEDVNLSSAKLIEITIKEDGKSKNYFVSKDVQELGTTIKGSMIKFHLNKDKEIDIILVK